MPGFYCPVVVMSPRVAPVPGAPALDQGGGRPCRPTYRIGYLKVRSWILTRLRRAHQENKETYKPRDVSSIRLAASPHKTAQRDRRFGVVVLDEAVFDSFKTARATSIPIAASTSSKIGLANYNCCPARGLQKFEKKGANAGATACGIYMRSISQ